MGVPKYTELIAPTLHALRELGGSAATSEIDAQVAKNLDLSQENLEQEHTGRASNTEFTYQMAWARTNLKKAGLIKNVSHATWALTGAGREADSVDPKEVRRKARKRE